jgi:uncharacterized membrane protein YhaH (DUF805 family)
MNYYFEVFKKWNVLSGRATRKEYWTFTLINLAIGVTAGVISGIFHNLLVANTLADIDVVLTAWSLVVIPSAIFALIILIPSICVLVRRLHDTNHNGGWWFLFYFAYFVPGIFESLSRFLDRSGWLYFFFYYFTFIVFIVIWVIWLVFTLSDSQPGSNKYGPNPKEQLKQATV